MSSFLINAENTKIKHKTSNHVTVAILYVTLLNSDLLLHLHPNGISSLPFNAWTIISSQPIHCHIVDL